LGFNIEDSQIERDEEFLSQIQGEKKSFQLFLGENEEGQLRILNQPAVLRMRKKAFIFNGIGKSNFLLV